MTQEEIRNKLAKHGIGYSMFSISVTRSGVVIDTDAALKLIDNGNLDKYVSLVKEDQKFRQDEATAEILAERNHPETLGEVMEGNSLARARRAKVMNDLVNEVINDGE